MANQISSEQYRKLFKTLPADIKEFFENIIDIILDICKRHNIEEYAFSIKELVTDVLYGLLPPELLEDELIKLELEPELVKKINQEIYRFVFYPLKNSLDELYNKTKPTIPVAGEIKEIPLAEKIELEIEEEKLSKLKQHKEDDIYREKI